MNIQTKEKKVLTLFGEAFLPEAVDSTDVWIINTGASHYMTKTKEFFSRYSLFDELESITLGNQKPMLALARAIFKLRHL